MLIGGRQRGEILADKATQLLLVVVADDDRLEVRGIAKTLLVDLEDAIVAGLVECLLYNGLQSWMMSVEDGANRVVVINLW